MTEPHSLLTTPPSGAPIVSVVLGSYNRLPFLKSTLASIRRELDRLGSGEIIVVDGGSNDGTVEWLTGQKDVVSIIQHNRGQWRGKTIQRRSWGYFMNLGFKVAQGKFICMVSDDCLLHRDSLRNGIAQFESHLDRGEKVGAAAFYWRNWPTQNHYWVGYTLGKHMFVNHGLYLASALAEIGYIDEERYSFYHADGDLCLKLWEEGWACIDCPASYVEHFADANMEVRASNLVSQQKDWQAYMARWPTLIDSHDASTLGGWIEREHHDPDETWRQFPRGEVYRRQIQEWHSRFRMPPLPFFLHRIAVRLGRMLQHNRT